jgi:hypothetical protein
VITSSHTRDAATGDSALSVRLPGTGPAPTRPAARQPRPWTRIRGVLHRTSGLPRHPRARYPRLPGFGGPLPAAA